MNLNTKVRIISDTTTFYPVEKEGDDSRNRNDDMSLRATLVYLHEQLGEDFQFFTADDLFIVLQQWRGMLFFIQTNDARFQDVMRLQLQTIREVLIFLFGPKFESVMKRSISMDKRKIFSQYVDSYLSLCQEDYIYLLNSIRVDSDSKELSDHFIQSISSTVSNFDINILNVTLFDGNKIVAHYDSPAAAKIDPETLLNLSIFEKVEYSDVNIESNDSDIMIDNEISSSRNFDPEFVKSSNNTTLKHKNAFLRIQRSPVCCLLSSSRLSERSPYIILVTTQNLKITDELRSSILQFITTITLLMSQFKPPIPEEKPIQVMEELIHYILIDRTHCTVWELPLDLSTGFLIDHLSQLKNSNDNKDDDSGNNADNQNSENSEGEAGEDDDNDDDLESEAFELMQKLTMQMAAYGMTAMMKGYTTMMWGEQDYQFCYELRFEDEKGELLRPTHVFSPPPFNDDNGVNYGLITSSIFPNTDGVTCLELLSIYRGGVLAKSVMAANDALFEFYRARNK